MNKNYNLKLDLQFRCNNSIMKFNQFDNNTSDFFMRITNGGNLVDIEKALVVLAVIKPSGKVSSQFVEVENGLVYADLKANMKDEIGNYTAQAMLILEDERVVTDVISYKVEEDKIFSLLNDTVEATEEFTLLTDMLSRLSTIEISEEQRVINEAERILSEENRKIEEAKRVEAELIRQHEEADRVKYDVTRESNENIRKQNESIRLVNETNRIDEETKRVEEENKRKLAEEERNANYNFMTEDEERRRLEANAHKEAEKLRAQAENTRVNEEAKRRTTEQARVSAENTRVSNENTRKANETTRQTNETHRVEAETQRQNRYNSFILEAEANANNFENYTNSAKIKEEERKSNELNRKSQEDRRVSNEVERISNENTRKANEAVREKNETSRQNTFTNKVNEVDKKIIELNTTKDNFVSSVNTKVDTKISELDKSKSDMTNTVTNKIDEVENRFNALTSKQQQDAEVIDARDGETSLKARLDRDIEKAKQVYVPIEGNHISTDSSSGYAKDVEILGNTVQDASNLADIRSVGDKLEGQELYEIPVLSCGKNLFDHNIFKNEFVENQRIGAHGGPYSSEGFTMLKGLKEIPKFWFNKTLIHNFVGCIAFYSDTYDGSLINRCYQDKTYAVPQNARYFRFEYQNYKKDEFQLEEGTQATPYETYIEDKLTILSPTPLEKVGDVCDRLIEKDGVWGVEKHIKTDLLKGGSDEGFGLNKALPKGGYQFTWFANMGATANKNSEVISSTMNSYVVSNEEYSSNIWIYDGVAYVIHHPTISTADEIKLWLQANPTIVKFALNTPQFIPLPHNQQIKLRTFANKTNISFGCEIEGTIKAQVPKSIGATVNTHTEQINNLNKELDRVKKLEESTVSTVTTESNFTTVEATSNGYFEDVKLEGKTLVNLNNFKKSSSLSDRVRWENNDVKNIQGGVTVWNLSDKPISIDVHHLDTDTYKAWYNVSSNSCKVISIGDNEKVGAVIGLFVNGWTSSELDKLKKSVIILEGDHAQNPPSYFEGLKSVGDGADEIVVSSVNPYGNLFDGELEVGSLNASGDTDWTSYVKTGLIRVKPSSEVICKIGKYKGENATSTDIRMAEYDMNKNFIKFSGGTYKATVSDKTHYVKFAKKLETSDDSRVDINAVSDVVVVYGNKLHDIPHQSDKKRLLYYNTETQAWEKPILRQWDSIEKHANGKYYYHQRSGEEDYTRGDESVSNYITDMTTTVKPLAQEKVYECTNIDLITYANETNFIVESGVLSPKTTLKVHSNISNVVSLLQKKVSLLESNMTKYMITQNRLMLASRYNADTVSFKVDVASFSDTFEYDNDLYELILNNILVGKDNYNREYIENLIIFYWMDFIISDEMYSTLFEIIEEQHNPKIEEGAPLI